jgi:CRP/FNR family transcriptional regulator, cyclic AMP receptor protein
LVHIDLFRNETEFDSFAAGTTIFSEGDQGKLMYVVLDGQVRLSIKNKEVEILGPGSVLGEMSLIDAAPRSATATAISDCKLVPISEQRFTFMVQQTPRFALQIMRVMADRLRAMDTRL